MADKYSQAQGLFQQGLGAAVNYEQGQKEMLMKQAEAAYKKLEDVRDTRFKLAVDPTLPEEVRLSLWNQAAAANNQLSPDFQLPNLDAFDPTTKAVTKALSERIQANAKLAKEEQRPLTEILKEFEPVFAASVALAQSKEGRAAGSDSQAAIMKLLEAQQSRTGPEGAPFETMQNGKPTLGRVNKQNEFIPITQQGGEPAVKPPEALSAEAAGKVSTAVTGLAQLQKAREALFDKDGNADKLELLFSKTGIPTKKAKTIRTNIEAAIDSKLRNESGATIGDEERKAEVNKYMPQLSDSNRMAKARLDDLEDILTNFVYVVDPNGKLKLEPKNKTESTRKLGIQNLKVTPIAAPRG